VKVAFEAEAPGGLPEIIIEYVPADTVDETTIVMKVDVPAADGVMVFGVKETTTLEEEGETEPASETL
jgi:hypothetical protein